MDCTPRQTPKTGTPVSAQCRTISTQTPASSGVPGPGESSTPSKPSAACAARDLVVAQHLALGAELVEVLDEVEDEAVVVVDHEDACAHRTAAYQPVLPSTVTSLNGSSGSAHGNTYWKRT